MIPQEHTNAIRRFQFVSLQDAAAYIAKSDKPDRLDKSDKEDAAHRMTSLTSQQQQAVVGKPTLEWSVILESLQLTSHQRKVCFV